MLGAAATSQGGGQFHFEVNQDCAGGGEQQRTGDGVLDCASAEGQNQRIGGGQPGDGRVLAVTERSLAVAIFDSGSSVGGAVAALVIPLIALAFGWRSAFIFSGALGFVWLLAWLRVYHPLDRHPRVTPEEASFIRAG